MSKTYAHYTESTKRNVVAAVRSDLAYAEWGNASASLNPQSANGSIVQGIQMSPRIGRGPDGNTFITLLSLGAISLALIAPSGPSASHHCPWAYYL